MFFLTMQIKPNFQYYSGILSLLRSGQTVVKNIEFSIVLSHAGTLWCVNKCLNNLWFSKGLVIPDSDPKHI